MRGHKTAASADVRVREKRVCEPEKPPLLVDLVGDPVIEPVAVDVPHIAGRIQRYGVPETVGMSARAFLAGSQDEFAVHDAVSWAEAALLKVSAVDVAHFDDVGEMDVLGLDPGHQVMRILV